MNASGVRARAKRLLDLSGGLGTEADRVLSDRGELLPDELTAYLASIHKPQVALRDAWLVLALAAKRLEGEKAKGNGHRPATG